MQVIAEVCKRLTRGLTLSQRIQLQMGMVIAVVLMGVTTAGYMQTVNSLRTEALDNLRSATRTRAALESANFVQAQENTVALREEYLRRLREADSKDPIREFNEWFVRYPDGLIRVRPERDDHRRLPSIYIRAQVPVTPALRRQVMVAFNLLREWGPAQTLRYFSVYIDLPGQSLIMYSPSVNWGKEADSTTNNFDYPPVQNSAPVKNPQRKTLWTEVYLDDKAKTWMLSVITPMDQGSWIGTASQDIAVEDLIRRTTNDFAPGTYNLVVDTQGRVVAHPRLMDQIQKSAGNLSIATLEDAELRGIWDVVRSTSRSDVAVTQLADNYLGIGSIEGPGWYFVTVYPRDMVEGRGIAAARVVLIAGMLG